MSYTMYQFEYGSKFRFSDFHGTHEVEIVSVRLFADSDGGVHDYITYELDGKTDHSYIRGAAEMARILSHMKAEQVSYPSL